MGSANDLPRVAVVLVNWNSRQDTLECLESVFRLSYPNFSVVVCDNNSGDGSLESIEAWTRGDMAVVPASAEFEEIFARPRLARSVLCSRYTRSQAEQLMPVGQMPDLILLETGGNLGFAGGNNVGIRFAIKHLRADYLWLLNTDTIVHKEALSALIERASRSTRVGMVGSSLIYYWTPGLVQALGGARLDRRTTRMGHIGDGGAVSQIPQDGASVESELAYVLGASMLVSRQFVEEVGPMNEGYFLYYEEIDWVCRASGRFSLGYAPDSLVFHKVGGSSRRVASTTSQRYLWRNRIKFVCRYMPNSLNGTLITMAGDMVRAFLKGQFSLSLVIAGALIDARRLCDEGRRMQASQKFL